MRVEESLTLLGIPVRKGYIKSGDIRTIYRLNNWLGEYDEIKITRQIAGERDLLGKTTHVRPTREESVTLTHGSITGQSKPEKILTTPDSTFRMHTRIPGLVHVFKTQK